MIKTLTSTNKKYLCVTTRNPFKYNGSSRQFKKDYKMYAGDIITEILFEDIVINKQTTAMFQYACLVASIYLDVVDNENFYNKKNEDGKIPNIDIKRTKNSLTKIQQSELIKLEKNYLENDILTNEKKVSMNVENIAEQDTIKIVNNISLNKVLNSLTAREERVLRMRFGLNQQSDCTLTEVAQVFSLSSERVKQIEAKALRKLKHPSRLEELSEILDEVA